MSAATFGTTNSPVEPVHGGLGVIARLAPPDDVAPASPPPGKVRAGVRYPKFADKFARLDFACEPMPVISLYPIPEVLDLNTIRVSVAGLDCTPGLWNWEGLRELPRYRQRQPLICQIFNWVEVVEWEGVRLSDFLDLTGVETHDDGYVAVYSRDGTYFEGLSMAEARDPQVMLATGMNGQPLRPEYGGPLRLVVPFLQGYKSVKWVGAIFAFRHDPVGIKRLLAQSRTARLAPPWRARFGIVPPEGNTSDPDPDPGTELISADDVASAVPHGGVPA